MFKVHQLIGEPISVSKVEHFDDIDLPHEMYCIKVYAEEDGSMLNDYITFENEDTAYDFVKAFKEHSAKSIDPIELGGEGEIFPKGTAE